VEKATELGVARLIPLRTSRGVVDPRDTKLERLRNVIIESCKQSRRPWLMELSAPQDFSVVIHSKEHCLVADPSGSALPAAITVKNTATVIAIGPEGGWTADELAAARSAGAAIVSLGDSILRIETAAVAVASWWRLTS
jgi:16S rRNA (uracil1498-N3)-methyltransferase